MKARWMRCAWTLGILGAAAFGGSSLVQGCSTERPVEPAVDALAGGWVHVHVQVPKERGNEFDEGGGLVRHMDPSEADGRDDVWLGFFPRVELPKLRARGFVVIEAPRASGLGTLANTDGGACDPRPSNITDRFCPYTGTSFATTCKRTISKELEDIATDFPPIGGVRFAETVRFGETHEKRPFLAARVGKLWKAGDPAVPQLVLYAGQHAREWAGPETMMRVFRHLAQSFQANTNGIRTLLAKVAVVIFPVANPDGYDFTHASMSNRLWRGNRKPCDGGVGTDPNRNFETTFGQPGSNPSCGDEQFRGPSASSEAETKALLSLLANDGLSGVYRTRFALNVHTYGNLVLFPDGLSKNLDICTTDSNCTAPDHGIMQDLMGTELQERMADDENGRSYLSGQTMRHLYPIGGDSIAASMYGSPSRPADPTFLSSLVEVTNTECGFAAESIPTVQFNSMANQVRALAISLAGKIPGLDSGAINPDLHLPHLHRRQAAGVAGEFPTLRVAVKRSLGNTVVLSGLGNAEVDDVRDGVTYRMWRARSTDPYVFPPEVPVCVGGKCTPAVLGDPGTGKIDLCSKNRFPSADVGWSFTPDQPGGPQAECFWTHAGTGAASLTSANWSIANMVRSKLVFSVRRPDPTAKMRVLLATNGFANCSFDPGTGCRIVREYPFGETNFPVVGSGYRTEILDVSDFDHAPAIQLRFEFQSGANSGKNMDIFDPVLVGWKG